jgi:DNA-binding SARP family transcriptional activator
VDRAFCMVRPVRLHYGQPHRSARLQASLNSPQGQLGKVSPRMHASLLGPFVCGVGKASVVPSAPKPRQLLTLFVLQQGRVQPVETLADELWGGENPPSAQTTLQTYILQIRRLLGRVLCVPGDGGAKSVLLTHKNGYALAAGTVSSDVAEFHRTRTLGQDAMDDRDWALASRHLKAALGLWRGEPLVDVPAGNVLKYEVMRLLEDKRAAELELIEANIHLGRSARLLPELRVLAARDPKDETLCALLMKALYHTGGASHALSVYGKTRYHLVNDLGVEPGPTLRRVYQSVLEQTL